MRPDSSQVSGRVLFKKSVVRLERSGTGPEGPGRPAEDLRRSGGDCHRKCPAIRGRAATHARAERFTGAADGDVRSALAQHRHPQYSPPAPPSGSLVVIRIGPADDDNAERFAAASKRSFHVTIELP